MAEPSAIDVTFLPGGEKVSVEAGVTVSEAAAQAELPLTLPCGGKGNCGNCRVVIQDGDVSEPTAAEFKPIARAQVLKGKCWTTPLLSNGQIYCRNAVGDVVCLDVR